MYKAVLSEAQIKHLRFGHFNYRTVSNSKCSHKTKSHATLYQISSYINRNSALKRFLSRMKCFKKYIDFESYFIQSCNTLLAIVIPLILNLYLLKITTQKNIIIVIIRFVSVEHIWIKVITLSKFFSQ